MTPFHLSLSDMYFLHEANDTFVEGLVNFEKMVGPLFLPHNIHPHG